MLGNHVNADHGVVGGGADHRDALELGARQRQQAIVLQQHQRFARGASCQRIVRRRLVDRGGNRRPRQLPGRIEHAQAHARGHQGLQRGVDLRFVDQALADRCRQGGVLLPAFQLGAVLDRQRSGLFAGGDDLVVLPDIHDRPAVGHHVAPEAPLVTQYILQQELAGAGRLAVHAVVGAHHRIHLALLDQCLERRQVGLVQVALGGARIEVVTIGFRATVHGQMLGGGVELAVRLALRVLRCGGAFALQALHEGHAHARGEEGILAVGFLAAAPARITEDIDVRRPEGQPLIARVLVLAQELMVLGARLVADRGGDLVHQR